MNRDDVLKIINDKIYDKFNTNEIKNIKIASLIQVLINIKIENVNIIDWCVENFKTDHLTKNSSKKEILYCFINNITTYTKCENCKSNNVKFDNFTSGYYSFCSKKCISSSPRILKEKEDRCFSLYGVKNKSSLEENINKRKSTCMDRYGVEYIFQSEQFKQQSVKTCNEKYGVDHVSKTKEHKDKFKISCMKKYGETHPSKNKDIRNKINKTIIDKYGTLSTLSVPELLNKFKNTCLSKYGVDNPSKDKDVNRRIREKLISNYSNENKRNEIMNKSTQTKINKYGSIENYKSHVGKNISATTRIKNFNNMMDKINIIDKFTPLFTQDEFQGYEHNYKWLCNSCKTHFNSTLLNGKIPKCPVCNPQNNSVSNLEKEIADFCKQYYPNLIENDRSVLNGRELDVYIPEINLAIEFDGLYWHSESIKNNEYHLSKTNECIKKGIKLIHIFEDEWVNKKDIVKSMLLSKMNTIQNKIYARNCTIDYMNADISSNFFNNNHIQGNVNAKMCLCLLYKNEIVAAMSLSSSRFDKKYDWEILRYCCKLNTSVVGGFSKLLNYFIRTHNPKNIITYCDKRYSVGNVYEKCGFVYSHNSKPNYFYTDNRYKERLSRIQFQKHKIKDKLKIFNESLTEWQNMQLNGYDRIWDCGNLVYVYEKGL